MSTKIRSSCPKCKEVDLRPEDVAMLSVDGAVRAYQFFCPKCGEKVERTADKRIATLLGSVEGVRTKFQHPELPPDSPPLTADDLIWFHDHLDEELEKMLP